MIHSVQPPLSTHTLTHSHTLTFDFANWRVHVVTRQIVPQAIGVGPHVDTVLATAAVVRLVVVPVGVGQHRSRCRSRPERSLHCHVSAVNEDDVNWIGCDERKKKQEWNSVFGHLLYVCRTHGWMSTEHILRLKLPDVCWNKFSPKSKKRYEYVRFFSET